MGAHITGILIAWPMNVVVGSGAVTSISTLGRKAMESSA